MKKSIKTAVMVLTAAVILILWQPGQAQAATPSEAKDSVVCIATADENGQLLGWGSGFAIGKPGDEVQYIATNYHVAQPTDKYGEEISCSRTVYFSAAAGRSMTAELYWSSEEHDLAVLRLPEPTDEREAMVLCPMDEVDLDDDYAALGYPAASMAADIVKFDQSDISVTRGGISKQVRVNGTDCYLVDIDISQGNSGGPLVNSKGQVVGINSFMIGDNARYAIAIDELIRNLDPDQISYTVAGSLTTRILIGVGIAAVIIVIIAAVILIKRKKRKGGKNRAASAGEMKGNERKIRTVPKGNAAVLMAGPASPLANRKFRIGGPVKIGRDGTRCKIAFPVDTKGVSAVHCEVEASEDGIVVRDLGSTYGTFLLDGTKLEKGQSRKLHSGDAFYLAGEDNWFEVR